MNKKIYLESIMSDIVEDHYENGEGDDTGCGLNEKVGKRFETYQELFKWLNGYYGLSTMESDYDCDFEGGIFKTEKSVANHSEEQNGGWMEPTAGEIVDWKEGKIKLYSEHFTIVTHKIA